MYFWSGSNRAGEIRALAKHGQNIGVAVDALDKGGLALQELLATQTVHVFVDSGAFGEVALDPDRGWIAERPIDDQEWRRRLGTYKQLAAALGARCYLVAPDRVGDQPETLCRLARYAHQLRELRELGAHIIVPVQTGDLCGSAFDRVASALLGFGDYVRGIPSKKAAASLEQIGELCASLPSEARVHLLGLSPWGKRYAEVMRAVGRPPALVACDSVRIRALVGKANGPGGGPRALTAATDEAKRRRGWTGRRLSAWESNVIKFEALDAYLASQQFGRGAQSL